MKFIFLSALRLRNLAPSVLASSGLWFYFMTASLPVPAFLFTSFWTLEASRSSNLYGGSNGGLVSFSQTLPFLERSMLPLSKMVPLLHL